MPINLPKNGKTGQTFATRVPPRIEINLQGTGDKNSLSKTVQPLPLTSPSLSSFSLLFSPFQPILFLFTLRSLLFHLFHYSSSYTSSNSFSAFSHFSPTLIPPFCSPTLPTFFLFSFSPSPLSLLLILLLLRWPSPSSPPGFHPPPSTVLRSAKSSSPIPLFCSLQIRLIRLISSMFSFFPSHIFP